MHMERLSNLFFLGRLRRIKLSWKACEALTCSWCRGQQQPLDGSPIRRYRKKLLLKKSSTWTSFSCSPSLPPHSLSLSPSEPQSALYKTSVHTDTQMYTTHLSTANPLPSPRNPPGEAAWRADVGPSWMSLRRSTPDRLPHSSSAADTGSVKRRCVCVGGGVLGFFFLSAVEDQGRLDVRGDAPRRIMRSTCLRAALLLLSLIAVVSLMSFWFDLLFSQFVWSVEQECRGKQMSDEWKQSILVLIYCWFSRVIIELIIFVFKLALTPVMENRTAAH